MKSVTDFQSSRKPYKHPKKRITIATTFPKMHSFTSPKAHPKTCIDPGAVWNLGLLGYLSWCIPVSMANPPAMQNSSHTSCLGDCHLPASQVAPASSSDVSSTVQRLRSSLSPAQSFPTLGSVLIIHFHFYLKLGFSVPSEWVLDDYQDDKRTLMKRKILDVSKRTPWQS